MIRVTKSQLKMRAKERPPGYEADVLSRATRIEGEVIYLDDTAHAELLAKYRPAPLPEPTLAELATNFGGAMARWLAAGLPVVTAEEYAARSAACEPCEYWDGTVRGGLGKCKACGCTRIKRWLATEQCKHPRGSRWPQKDQGPRTED